MGDSSQSSENQNVDRNADTKSQAQKASAGIWIRGQVWYAFAEDQSTLCSYPETLQEIEVKDDGLIIHAEETSKQLNIQVVSCVQLTTVSQISETQGEKVGKKNLKFWITRNHVSKDVAAKEMSTIEKSRYFVQGQEGG